MFTNHYTTILSIHSILRWLVLLAGSAALLGCVIGMVRNLSFAPLGRILGLIYVSLLDTQFLVGVLLSLASPIVHALWLDPAAGMKQHDLRFFAVEHPTLMILALALAHIGAVKSRRAKDSHKAYTTALIWYGISFLLILGGIPWWRH